MDNPMLAELDAVVRPDAWAWRSDGMTGWALGHIRPTPENTHKFHERNTAVRGLYFAETLHAPLADMAKRLEAAERDARRWRHARKLLTVDDIEGAQGSYDSFGGIVSEDECKRADAAIDAAQEGEG